MSSETICRIVLIFGGNIHLMPTTLRDVYLSVCPWTPPRLSDFLNICWKYPGQHTYVGRIVLIFGGNIHLMPEQHINYIFRDVYMSVCPGTTPRLSDFLNIRWKYPIYARTIHLFPDNISILSIQEHINIFRDVYLYVCPPAPPTPSDFQAGVIFDTWAIILSHISFCRLTSQHSPCTSLVELIQEIACRHSGPIRFLN